MLRCSGRDRHLAETIDGVADGDRGGGDLLAAMPNLEDDEEEDQEDDDDDAVMVEGLVSMVVFLFLRFYFI